MIKTKNYFGTLRMQGIFVIRTGKYEIDLYLINDKNHPVKKIPEDCFVIDSEVDRGFNIDGLDFIKEEYKIFKNIVDTKKYDLLIKVDSDTWLNNLDWIEKININDICEAGHVTQYNIPFVNGPCYILTIPAIYYLYDTIYSVRGLISIQLKLKNNFPEDVVKSYILRNNTQINLNDYNHYTTYKKYLCPYDYSDPEIYDNKTTELRKEALDKIKARYYKELAAK